MNSSEPNFTKSETLAKELRMLQLSSNLALNVLEMEFDRYIYFDTFENFAKTCNIPLNILTMGGMLSDGYTIRLKGQKNIILYYEKNKGKPRLNWTLAHEVGHIYFNHNEDGDTQEVEAHCFAAELLMPSSILLRITRKANITPDIISKTFFVSTEAASNKIKTFRRGGIGSTYLNRELSEKYNQQINDIISQYKKSVSSTVNSDNNNEAEKSQVV